MPLCVIAKLATVCILHPNQYSWLQQGSGVAAVQSSVADGSFARAQSARVIDGRAEALCHLTIYHLAGTMAHLDNRRCSERPR